MALGGAQQRAVLAVLLWSSNQAVSIDRLVDLVWNEQPPPTARQIVGAYVSRLRTALARIGADDQVQLARVGDGYALRIDPELVDTNCFRRLVEQGRAAVRGGDPAAAINHLHQALKLWPEGEQPFAGTQSEGLQRVAVGLQQTRLDAIEILADLELRTGDPNGWSEVLQELAGQYPERERIAALAVDALTLTGRRNAALTLYRQLVARIRDELDSEPSGVLKDAQQRALRDEQLQPLPPAPASRQPPPPAQLPLDVHGFTGRTAQLRLLDNFLADLNHPGAVVITAIAGTAGVGKTALAVHWAHRVRDRFPDGQLYVDLRGYSLDPSVRPAQSLELLLRGLGVPGEQIPPEVDARAALYRTLLSDKRILVVLDNAADVDQVRPLLPGSRTCLALVTSRDQLEGLVALDGGRRVDLDTLGVEESLEVLARILQPGRVAAEPHAVGRLAELCARLPLALRIAAARLYSQPHITIAEYVAELDSGDRLSQLAIDGDRHAILRTHLDISYAGQPPEAQRLFRQLGLHPGTDISPYAAAALAKIELAQARELLTTLANGNLIQQHAPGRYMFHDLLRAYAADRAQAQESRPAQQAALGRLADHYEYTASTAVGLAYPNQVVGRPVLREPDRPGPNFETAARARAWLEIEHENLLAVAGSMGFRVTILSAVLAEHLHIRAYRLDAEVLHTQAYNAAHAAGGGADEYAALRRLGHTHRMQQRYQDSIDCFECSLELTRRAGDRTNELDALWGLGNTHEKLGHHDLALRCYEQALAIADDLLNRPGQVNALCGMGHVYYMQGRFGPALECHERALGIACEIGDRHGENYAHWGLGTVYCVTGQYHRALEHHRRALAVAEDIGHRGGQVSALIGLAIAYRRQNSHDDASHRYDLALTIAKDIGDRMIEGSVLCGLGDIRRLQRRYGPASSSYRQALLIARRMGDRNGEFEALLGLGNVLREQGCLDDALAHHQAALAVGNELGQHHDQARALDGIATTHHDLGEVDAALAEWEQALAIFTELDAPEAATVRARLTASPS